MFTTTKSNIPRKDLQFHSILRVNNLHPDEVAEIFVGFSVWPEYFFLSLSGPKYFFSNYHEPEYFFLKPYWARIFFSIQYKQIWKQLFSWAANRFQNYYIEVVCCLSVCVSDRDDFKWHNIANSTYIAIPLYMRVYTPDIISYLVNFLFDLGPIMARHVFL